MKKFKSLMAGVLAGAMLVSMIGCGKSAANEPAPSAGGSDGGNTEVSAEIKTAVDGKLTWATNAAFEPYEYYGESGAVEGIDADIMDAIAAKLGLEASVEDMEFDSIITAVTSGKVDVGIAGMTVTEDRLQNVDFSTPYVNAGQVVIVRFDSSIKAANEIDGKTVGVQLGTTGDLYVTENYPDTAVERYNKGFEAVEALLQKKIDAVVIDGDTAQAFVAANSNDDLVILDESLTEEQYAIAVAKGNDALLNAINDALAELQESGELDAIMVAHKGETEEEETEGTEEAEDTEAADEAAEAESAA